MSVMTARVAAASTTRMTNGAIGTDARARSRPGWCASGRSLLTRRVSLGRWPCPTHLARWRSRPGTCAGATGWPRRSAARCAQPGGAPPHHDVGVFERGPADRCPVDVGQLWLFSVMTASSPVWFETWLCALRNCEASSTITNATRTASMVARARERGGRGRTSTAKSGKVTSAERRRARSCGGRPDQRPGVNSAVAGSVSACSSASRSTSAMSWTCTSSSRWASFTPSSIIT